MEALKTSSKQEGRMHFICYVLIYFKNGRKDIQEYVQLPAQMNGIILKQFTGVDKLLLPSLA